MASERTSKLPVVAQAEAALRSLGVRQSAFDQKTVRRSNWYADWAGRLSGSDVYIAVTGKGPDARKVRLLLDAWIFDDVPTDKLGALLTQIFSDGATLSRKRSLLVGRVQVLKVSVGRSHYSAARKLPPPDQALSPWERRLTVDSDA